VKLVKVKIPFPPFSPIMAEIGVQEKDYIAYGGNQHVKYNVPKNCAIGGNHFDSDSGSFADWKLGR
jgi:hypothetical protein